MSQKRLCHKFFIYTLCPFHHREGQFSLPHKDPFCAHHLQIQPPRGTFLESRKTFLRFLTGHIPDQHTIHLKLRAYPLCLLSLPVVGYLIPGLVGRVHDMKIGRFSKHSSPSLSHHWISSERHHRNTLHRCKLLQILRCSPPRILERLEFNVTGPGHINPNCTQPHHGQAALHG